MNKPTGSYARDFLVSGKLRKLERKVYKGGTFEVINATVRTDRRDNVRFSILNTKKNPHLISSIMKNYKEGDDVVAKCILQEPTYENAKNLVDLTAFGLRRYNPENQKSLAVFNLTGIVKRIMEDGEDVIALVSFYNDYKGINEKFKVTFTGNLAKEFTSTVNDGDNVSIDGYYQNRMTASLGNSDFEGLNTTEKTWKEMLLAGGFKVLATAGDLMQDDYYDFDENEEVPF